MKIILFLIFTLIKIVSSNNLNSIYYTLNLPLAFISCV